MSLSLTPRALAVALLTLATPVLAQGFDPNASVVRRADTNADGDIDEIEWGAFLEEYAIEKDGALDVQRLKVALLVRDVDGNGVITGNDVDLGFDDFRAGGTLSFVARALADQNNDGEMSNGERTVFIRNLGRDTELDLDTLIDWMRQAEAIPPVGDRNAFNAGVFLLGLNSSLDEDKNGKVEHADLERIHAAYDKDGDGVLQAVEISPRGGAGRNDPVFQITDELRAKPTLMPWQRNLDDALALQRGNGKPLLICVNMDDETASDQLAYDHYRNPEFVALVDGFIPLIVSPDRHNPRDHDDRGRRIPDERFGRVVNSEHIDLEPLVYDLYFNENRVAPRHVGVSPEGEILFDLYLLNDLSEIAEKLKEFGVPGEPAAPAESLSEDALLASPDAVHRSALEERFIAADVRVRARLASLALSDVREVQHPELVRLALRDRNAAVRRQAVWSMIQHAETAPVDLLPIAYRETALDEDLRATLLAAMSRLVAAAEDDGNTERQDNAAFYLRAFTQLEEPSARIDPARWRLALETSPEVSAEETQPEDEDEIIALLEAIERALRSDPDDVDLLCREAATRLRLADVQIQTGGNPSFFFEDAILASERALRVAPSDGRALGYLARASYMLVRFDEAHRAAAEALPALVRDAETPLAGQVLDVFTRTGTQELYRAMGEANAWDPELVPDLVAAYEAYLLHPSSDESTWRSYLDMLGSLKAYDRQHEVVRRGLAQYPTSSDLHTYLRFLVLRDDGAGALENVYSGELFAEIAEDVRGEVDWYSAFAMLAAAEHHVQDKEPEAAAVAYELCIDTFEKAALELPDSEGSIRHYQGLALAGKARVDATAGRYEEAIAAVVDAVGRAPKSIEVADGLGKTPAETVQEVRDSLRRAGVTELSSKLERGLSEAGYAFARSVPRAQ